MDNSVSFRVSEIFYSLQGEGYRVGVPSIFIRFFGCNFTCPGFGMRKGEISDEADRLAKHVIENKEKYPTYKMLPLAKTGCDSYPSWHKDLAEYSPKITGEQLIEKVNSLIVDQTALTFPTNIDLVFTGGEPLLKANQKKLANWIESNIEWFKRFPSITFETNGSQKLSDVLINALNKLENTMVIFSISPKLSCSGVEREKAICPDVITAFSDYLVDRHVNFGDNGSEMYLKFVVSDEDDLFEVQQVCEIVNIDKCYKKHHAQSNVYLMPEGGFLNSMNAHSKVVGELCMKYQITYCDRLHCRLWDNSWGR